MVKRSLPVLPAVDGPTASSPSVTWRPAWHWVVIGAAFVFIFWMPLVLGAEWLIAWTDRMGHTLASSRDWRWLRGAQVIVPLLGSVALAAGSGVFLVGFFATGATRFQMALSGALAVVAAWLLALFAGSLEPWWLAVGSLAALVSTAVPSALLGGAIGRGLARRTTTVPTRRRLDSRDSAH